MRGVDRRVDVCREIVVEGIAARKEETGPIELGVAPHGEKNRLCPTHDVAVSWFPGNVLYGFAMVGLLVGPDGRTVGTTTLKEILASAGTALTL